MTKLTYTLAIDHQPDRDGGVALELVDVDLDNLTAYERAVIDAIGIIAGAVLGLDRIDHPAAAAPQQVTDLAGTAERAPVVTAAPATDEDREYLRSPERLKNQTPAKKAAAKKPAVKGPVRREDTVPYEKRGPGKATKPKAGVPSGCGMAILTGLHEEGPFTGSGSELGALYGTGAPKARTVKVNQLVGDGYIRREGPRGKATFTITDQGRARLGATTATAAPERATPPPAPATERERLAPVPDIEPDDVDDLAWAAEAL